MDAAAKRQAARAQTAPKKNPRLYEDHAGNIKARKKPKQQAKKAAFSPPARGGERPEDNYGVRNRRRSSRKSVGKNSLSVSRDRRAASSASLVVAA